MSLLREDRDYNVIPGFNLKEEQVEAIDFALRKQNCIISLQTGLGKEQPNSSMIPTPSGSCVRMGDLSKGDYILDRYGKPTKILGVYPQGVKDVYEVILKDGRKMRCGVDHLFSCYLDRDKDMSTISLREMLSIKDQVESTFGKLDGSRKCLPIHLPVCHPVEYKEQEFSINPYVMGVLLGHGCLTQKPLIMSSNDEFVVEKVAALMGVNYRKLNKRNYSWSFVKDNKRSSTNRSVAKGSVLTTKEFFECFPGLVGKCSHELYIPIDYYRGSVEQRFSLLRGLLDTNGYAKSRINENRISSLNYSTVSYKLACGIREICNSLGIQTSLSITKRNRVVKHDREQVEYTVLFLCEDSVKERLVSLPRRLEQLVEGRTGRKSYDTIAVADIKKLDYQEESTCIMVDNDEHLYLAEDFIVTHNTIVGLTASYHILKQYSDTVCFIVCPKSANTAFKKELAKFKVPFGMTTTDEKIVNPHARYHIFNYSCLEVMIDHLLVYRKQGIRVFGIFDEVHMLQDQNTQRVKLLRYYREHFTCILGMTATPLLNAMEGLWSVIDFVKPGYLGTFHSFCKNYIEYEETVIGKFRGRLKKKRTPVAYKNLDVLKLKIDNIAIIRRVKYDINFIYRKTDMSEYELVEYEKAARGIMEGMKSNEGEKAFSARLHDLQRVVDGSHLEISEEYIYSKVKLLFEVIRECISRGEGLLIYTDYEDTYAHLGKWLEKYKGYLGYKDLYYITGKTTYKKRIKVEQSLSNGDIVIVTEAGTASINLQAVNNCVFYNIPWAISSVIQFVGRVTRIDSKHAKQNIYYLEVNDTIDTYKRLLIESHSHVIRALFGNEGALPESSIDKDLMKKKKAYFKKKFLWKTIK